jgi:Xaa-Pro aminopeptidase
VSDGCSIDTAALVGDQARTDLDDDAPGSSECLAHEALLSSTSSKRGSGSSGVTLRSLATCSYTARTNGSQLEDATAVFDRCMFIKSPAEIDAVRRAT